MYLPSSSPNPGHPAWRSAALLPLSSSPTAMQQGLSADEEDERTAAMDVSFASTLSLADTDAVAPRSASSDRLSYDAWRGGLGPPSPTPSASPVSHRRMIPTRTVSQLDYFSMPPPPAVVLTPPPSKAVGHRPVRPTQHRPTSSLGLDVLQIQSFAHLSSDMPILDGARGALPAQPDTLLMLPPSKRVGALRPMLSTSSTLTVSDPAVDHAKVAAPSPMVAAKKRPNELTLGMRLHKRPSRCLLRRDTEPVISCSYLPVLPQIVDTRLKKADMDVDIVSPSSSVESLHSAAGHSAFADLFADSGSPALCRKPSLLFQRPKSADPTMTSFFLPDAQLSSSPTQSPTNARHTRKKERCASSVAACPTRSYGPDSDRLQREEPTDLLCRPVLPLLGGIEMPQTACPIVTLPTPPAGQEGRNPFAELGPVSMRRHHSVCDPAFMSASAAASAAATGTGVHYDDKASPAVGVYRPVHTSAFYAQHGSSQSVDLRVPMTPNSSLAGHGANEHDGKVLPCHRVKEDGLMRITAETLAACLPDKLGSTAHPCIERLLIFDCRQAYEHEGGHIRGAINISSQQEMEKRLFDELAKLPLPSTSAKQKGTARVVIVIHCEFSLKRGPAMAKFIRSRDRARNSYPDVHYPELYILEGGYHNFYKTQKTCCEPQGYTPMNEEDLDKLLARPSRHFKRAASWAAPQTTNEDGVAASLSLQQSLANVPARRCDARLRIRIPGKENVQQLPRDRADVLSPSSFVFPSLSSAAIAPRAPLLPTFPGVVVRAIREEDSGADSSSGPDSPMNMLQMVGGKRRLMPAVQLRAPLARVASYNVAIPTGTKWMG